MERPRLLDKQKWKEVVGKEVKPRRLKILRTANGLYFCPVKQCDSEGFKSQRGCRKHVYVKHGWYYFFDEKPDQSIYFPMLHTRQMNAKRKSRSITVGMPMFAKDCTVAILFEKWLMSPGGGGKGLKQSNQITIKLMKFGKFCCEDVSSDWNVPESVLDYCVGSITLISEFIEHLQNQWNVGFSGVISYMSSLSHFLDFRRSQVVKVDNLPVFAAVEVYIHRVKKCLTKKMKSEWNVLLSIEYLDSINSWATVDDLNNVIPYHADKFSQILINASDTNATIPAHDLSFSTAFITTILFIMVKATRPMTYQYLTVDMVRNVPFGGIIDQSEFKTNFKYGFDSLVISSDCAAILIGYLNCIRPRLNPTCSYLLVSRSGKQLTNLCNVFGRLVYEAIGKYISPTRYRQIIETESATSLSVEEQRIVSEDQKHSSHVAQVHYQKQKSQAVAVKGRECFQKLVSNQASTECIKEMQEKTSVNSIKNFTKVNNTKQVSVSQETVQRKIHFSSHEDEFIRQGIIKYSGGKWTSILKDPSYTFHPCRRVSTIFLRAKKLKLI